MVSLSRGWYLRSAAPIRLFRISPVRSAVCRLLSTESGRGGVNRSAAPAAAVAQPTLTAGKKTFPTSNSARSFNRNSTLRHRQQLTRDAAGAAPATDAFAADRSVRPAGAVSPYNRPRRPYGGRAKLQPIDADMDGDAPDADASADADATTSSDAVSDDSNLPVDISSVNNSLVKRLQKLGSSKKARHASGSFVVDGRRCIDAFLSANGGKWKPLHILIRSDHSVPLSWSGWIDQSEAKRAAERAETEASTKPEASSDSPLDELLSRQSTDAVRASGDRRIVYRVNRRVSDAVSNVTTSSGYFAEFAMPPPAPAADSSESDALVDWSAGGLIIDGVSDAGNLGSIIRSALAFGWNQVIALDGCVDAYSPKVISGSAGAISNISTLRCGVTRQQLVAQFTKHASTLSGGVYALVPSGGVSPLSLPLTRSYWLVIGNEAHGLSDQLNSLLAPTTAAATAAATATASASASTSGGPLQLQRLTVPMALSTITGSVDSLNAGVAASISMFALSPFRKKRLA